MNGTNLRINSFTSKGSLELMDSHLKNINSYWAYLLIEELIRNKVDTFFISPGSRSTPLTLAVAENKKADKIICFDERAAAFAALGYARAANKPAVLICTSGTAAANYYPAVIEAKQSHIPMILLTADRPPELRDTGANQTIRQTEMFGSYPNWQFEMPCPTAEIPSAMVLTTIDQAVFRANNPVAGPVHLNCMFREPLAPTAGPLPKSYLKQAVVWKKSTNPYTAYLPPEIAVAQDEADKILHLFNGTRKGLLVVGELNDIATQKAVISLAEKLKWPVFADITSGVRQAGALLPNMEYYDLLLLSDKVQKILNPQVILHLGRPVTSKRFLQFQQNYPAGEYIQVSDSTDRHDPNHRVTRRVYSDVSQFCLRIAAALNGTSDKKWFVAVNEKNSLIRRIMEDRFSGQVEVSEIAAARFIAQSLPEKHGLFLASSMPVRDFDMFRG
ncbi:MAG: 2-succinyl-5-enolpyruvyl-6-hydroxy-3-cyclohexene-1-carboxylic-acid synthase [Calditrichales bacterium]|nr:MAG: 2-succinyl-5-enolpyruvyl-6-hydroxy-3-cyclohexene-1-carboxylic-acid synthase [Calditrichales bacterium]